MSPPDSRLAIVEPGSLRPITEVSVTSDQQLAAQVSAARRASRDWSRRPCVERTRLLETFAERLVRERDELVRLLVRENGKPEHEAWLHEFAPLQERLHFLCHTAPLCLRTTEEPSRFLKHRKHRIEHQPYEVTAILGPSNFPLLIPLGDAMAALAAGSTVLIKPSEHCPLALSRAVELAHEVGIPKEVLSVVLGDGSRGAALVAQDVDVVLFTGTRANGLALATAWARRPRPMSLELGGNCPCLVLEGADLERAARAIVTGSLVNSGQCCVGIGRVLVHHSLERPLLRRLTELMEPLRQGDPTTAAVDLGALCTHQTLERAEQHLAHACARGAELRFGGRRLPQPGNYLSPALIARCPDDCELFLEETFAPTIVTRPFDTLAEALSRAHLGEHGLIAYVFGAEPNQAASLAHDLDAAHVVFDDVFSTYVSPELPLAPRWPSGTGVTHGRDGLLFFTRPKVIATPAFSIPPQLQFAWGRARGLGRLLGLGTKLLR